MRVRDFIICAGIAAVSVTAAWCEEPAAPAAVRTPTFAELKREVAAERGRLQALRRRQDRVVAECASLLAEVNSELARLEARLDRAAGEEKERIDAAAASLERKNRRLACEIEQLKTMRQQLRAQQEKIGGEL